jgi:hypothetical protein
MSAFLLTRSSCELWSFPLARRKVRKQRVVLRRRRRDELKLHLRTLFVRTAILAAGAGFALGLISHGDPVLMRFLRSHIPEIEVKAPQALQGLPWAQSWPTRRYLLWIPGSGKTIESHLKAAYPAIKSVTFQRSFQANRIFMVVEPRTPIVRWNESGMDGEGVLFPIVPGSWVQLPKVSIKGAISKPALGSWLSVLAQVSDFWNQLSGVRDDALGQIVFDFKSGAQINWGDMDRKVAKTKALNLCMVLQDAHEHLGGAASADLRFFDEGRIIVRPKGVSK